MLRHVIFLALSFLFACASSRSDRLGGFGTDLGGWMVDAESVDMKFGVHRYQDRRAERFVLQELVRRNEEGQVVEWRELATLNVPVRRDEFVLQGFECGSQGRRGDVIAVGRGDADNLTIIRAWRIDLTTKQFVPADPFAVTCEQADEEE
ncbi:MAG TPA: hypothetical protein VF883_03740 [Thermoanaerobaculia bacterium]